MTSGIAATSATIAAGCALTPLLNACCAELAHAATNSGAIFSWAARGVAFADGKTSPYTNPIVAIINGSSSPPMMPASTPSKSRPR